MPTESEQLRALIDGHGIPISRLAPALGMSKQAMHNQLNGTSGVSQVLLIALTYAPTKELKRLADGAGK